MSLMDSRIKRREQQMKELNEIGLLLSSERDLKKLLHLVVSKSIRLTSADGGALYLLEPIPENEADVRRRPRPAAYSILIKSF